MSNNPFISTMLFLFFIFALLNWGPGMKGMDWFAILFIILLFGSCL